VLRTRLHGKSPRNSSFKLVDEKGTFLCEVSLVDAQGVSLDINTASGIYIVKPNGWTSNKGKI